MTLREAVMVTAFWTFQLSTTVPPIALESEDDYEAVSSNDKAPTVVSC